MICLALETATTNCSVALYNVFIEDLLKNHEIEFKDLDTVAVGSGPGSYTGLRIGLATAKGFCFALNIPLISINTLESMILGAQVHLKGNKSDGNVLFCPMIDARRMEVYTMLTDEDLNPLIATTAMIINDDCQLVKYKTQQTIVYFGNGAQKCEEILSRYPNFNLETLEFNPSSARFMGKLINQKYHNGIFEDVAYYEPNYLKEFQTTTPKKLL